MTNRIRPAFENEGMILAGGVLTLFLGVSDAREIGVPTEVVAPLCIPQYGPPPFEVVVGLCSVIFGNAALEIESPLPSATLHVAMERTTRTVLSAREPIFGTFMLPNSAHMRPKLVEHFRIELDLENFRAGGKPKLASLAAEGDTTAFRCVLNPRRLCHSG